MRARVARAVARESMIPLDNEDTYGPAMKKLTDARKRFVIAYVYYGGVRKSPLEACTMAGFGGTEQSRKTTSYRLMRDPAILAGLREETDKLMIGYGARAAHRLNELIDSESEKVSLDAAKSMLGFAGHLMNRSEHRIVVEHEGRSTAELIEYVQQSMKKMAAMTPAQIAHMETEAVDAEFTEVPKQEVKAA